MKIVAVYDKRLILVYGKIAFYQSTGTSGSGMFPADIRSLRYGTFFPFFGAHPDGHLIKPSKLRPLDITPGCTVPSYEPAREIMGTGTNTIPLRCDDALYELSQRGLITNDMASRFRFHDALVISAQLGYGFWASDNGKKIIAELKANCPYFKPIRLEDYVDAAVPVYKADPKGDVTNAQHLNNALRNNGAVLSGYSSEQYFDEYKEALVVSGKIRKRLIDELNFEQLSLYDRERIKIPLRIEIDQQVIPGALKESIAAEGGRAIVCSSTIAVLRLRDSQDKHEAVVKRVPIWARSCK